jgi:hypothetical protein
MKHESLLAQALLQFRDQPKDVRKSLSAVSLVGDRDLWLGSDEGFSLERLSRIESSDLMTFGDHQSFPLAQYLPLPGKPDAEIDIEGLAYAEPYLWIVGSHSLKRKKNKSDRSDAENLKRLATIASPEPNRYLLARIPLIDGTLKTTHSTSSDEVLTAALLEPTKRGNLLTEVLAVDPHLGTIVDAPIPGKENGFDVEGLAVQGNRIFVGLRGPVLRGWAIILEVAVKMGDRPDWLKLRKLGTNQQRYKKYFLDLQGLGIRELSFEGADLLILAGPTLDVDGPVKLFRWGNALNTSENSFLSPEELFTVPNQMKADRAEGLTILTPMTGQPSILITYDSPASDRLQDPHAVLADIFHYQREDFKLDS